MGGTSRCSQRSQRLLGATQNHSPRPKKTQARITFQTSPPIALRNRSCSGVMGAFENALWFLMAPSLVSRPRALCLSLSPSLVVRPRALCLSLSLSPSLAVVRPRS